jgi:hypothetical protein
VAVRYEWANDEQLIMYIFIESPWTWTEYLETVQTLKTLIDALDHPCATIVDATHYGSLPKDGNAIQVLLKIDKLLSENIFASALVKAPHGVTVFLNVMMKLHPRLSRILIFAETVDEASTEILERYRQMRKDNP